ncbi:MAG: uracil-DNA glycosylase family protein [Chitinophagales bacterium]
MIKNTFAEKVISFNKSLQLTAKLPPNIGVMNPFAENEKALQTSSQFYRKFYNDNKGRKLLVGINPGRFGAGITGIPFTDSKRMKEFCGLDIEGIKTYELSAVFVYDVIEAYGGAEAFYEDVYISSVCPLGFVIRDARGKEKNYNYYDSKALQEAVTPFIIKSIEAQLEFGIDRSTVFCMGSGKNFKFLNALNKEKKFFGKIVPLEHPRYVMQYKLKSKQLYVDKYLQALGGEGFGV